MAAMAGKRAAVGTIKLFDRIKGRGVITPQDVARNDDRDLPEDLYFEVDPNKPPWLKVGQLVQFVVEGSGKDAEARDVTVLSELA
jgi:cold shock CspA family protein